MNTSRDEQTKRATAELGAWVAAGGQEGSAPAGPAAAYALMFIGRHVAERGYAPSFRQIQSACGLSSLCLVHRAVNHLRTHHYIEREHGVARSLVLTRKAKDALRPILRAKVPGSASPAS